MKKRKAELVYIFSLSLILISCSLFNYDISIIVSRQNDKPELAVAPTQTLPIFYGIECITSSESPEIGYMTEVIDGDSIKAEINGKEYEIRYIGVNTPEYYSNERVAAEKASQENKKMIEGKKLYLFRDKSNTDKFKRLLRYVFTEDYFVNYELVKRGLAESKPYLPDVSCQALFDQAAK